MDGTTENIMDDEFANCGQEFESLRWLCLRALLMRAGILAGHI